jgi:hypothetical protein
MRKKLLIIPVLFLAGCTSLSNVRDYVEGADDLAKGALDGQPVLKIANYDYINGNRYIEIVEVNGEDVGKKSGFLQLDFGRNYVKVECGRNNASSEEGVRLRYSEVHHLYAAPGERYSVEFFSRAFEMPEDNFDVKYCSTSNCESEMGSDKNKAVCNVFFTNDKGAVRTYVFGQKRIF